MAIINDNPFCVEHNTDEYIWYTPTTNVYQCDACWDNSVEKLFGVRQYDTPRKVVNV